MSLVVNSNIDVVSSINAALSDAKVSVTNWGSRRVLIENQNLPLNTYVQSTLAKLNQLSTDAHGKADLTLEGRVAALAIVQQLKELVSTANEAVKTKNIFSRVLAYLSNMMFGTVKIEVAGINPFNEGRTRLEQIRANLDLSDAEYSPEQASVDLGVFSDVLAHAIWEAAGAPDFRADYDFGRITLNAEPKGDLVKRAIDTRLLAFPTLARYNSEGVQPVLPVAFV